MNTILTKREKRVMMWLWLNVPFMLLFACCW